MEKCTCQKDDDNEEGENDENNKQKNDKNDEKKENHLKYLENQCKCFELYLENCDFKNILKYQKVLLNR